MFDKTDGKAEFNEHDNISKRSTSNVRLNTDIYMHFLHQVEKTAQGHSTTTNLKWKMNSRRFTPSKPLKTENSKM